MTKSHAPVIYGRPIRRQSRPSPSLSEIGDRIDHQPSHPDARVMFRCRVSPRVEFLDLSGDRIQRLVQLTRLIEEARP